MAQSNNNKKTYIGLAVAVVVIIVVVIVAAILGNKGKNGATDGDNGNNNTSQSAGLTASDLSNVAISVDFGDYDTMQSLSSDIQNGRATGKVVKIDGTVSHPGSMYSIVQSNSQGTSSIGTRFVIANSDNYPKDKDRIVITGKVIELEPLVYVIQTLPDFIETKSAN